MSTMRNRKLAVLGIAALAMTLATGCAKPPQQEIDGLKAAMSAAEQAEAPKYAADAWSAAKQSMDAVNAEVEAQANKFALFRSYTKTKELITAASSAAQAAQDAAAAGKEAAKNAANEALAAAQASIDAANMAMEELAKCRRQPKDFKKDMEAMRGMLDGYMAQVAGVQSAIASEDYFGARSSAESLKASVDSLAADLASAKERIRC
jgi:hypothetical protein